MISLNRCCDFTKYITKSILNYIKIDVMVLTCKIKLEISKNLEASQSRFSELISLAFVMYKEKMIFGISNSIT